MILNNIISDSALLAELLRSRLKETVRRVFRVAQVISVIVMCEEMAGTKSVLSLTGRPLSGFWIHTQ